MPEERVLSVAELAVGEKKLVKVAGTEILLVHSAAGFAAVQPKCPHAQAPLEEGAVCDDRLICPWHLGTFALPGGELLEPPPLQSLRTYPVRITNGEIFVSSEAIGPVRPPARQTSVEPLFLVVGGGAAGLTAAVTLRQHGFAGKLTVAEPVIDEPVDRTQLSKDGLSGKMPLDKIAMDPLASLDLELIRSAVVEFSAVKHSARLSNGQLVQFAKAVVCTGASPKRLPVPGADLAHTIRHSRDVLRIHADAEGKRSVAIIGTSFIGLEAASALTEKGLQVTVIGESELPFANQFGDRVAKALLAFHETKGTQFKLGVQVERIEPDGVVFRQQGRREKQPADLVVMGVGVVPELSFQHDLPVARDGGIETGRSLVAAPDVWVAGDIASVQGTRIEHWRLAQQQGRVAALGMLGNPAVDPGVPYFWTYHFGNRLGYLGHAKDWDEVNVHGDLSKLQFIAFYIKSDQVKAILSGGYESELAAFAEPMRRDLSKDEALRRLADASGK